MNPNKTDNSQSSVKVMAKTLIILLALTITGLTLSIPFAYESMTLWYKVGIDKTLLRIGKMAGLLTAILISLQIFAAARPKLLVELFGLRQIMGFHRANGIAIFLLATCHAGLVIAPEGFTNLPLGVKHWPEIFGASLLLVIVVMFTSSQFRERLQLSYANWRFFHKPLGYLALILMLVHVRFASDSFDHPVPQIGLYLLTGLTVLGIAVAKLGKK